MLDYPGRNIKLVIRYAEAKYTETAKDTLYKYYVTDCLKALTESIAGFLGGGAVQTRYCDIINPAPDNITDETTAEEIINNVKLKLEKMKNKSLRKVVD